MARDTDFHDLMDEWLEDEDISELDPEQDLSFERLEDSHGGEDDY